MVCLFFSITIGQTVIDFIGGGGGGRGLDTFFSFSVCLTGVVSEEDISSKKKYERLQQIKGQICTSINLLPFVMALSCKV
jgi:hypothetical protein